MSFARLGSRSIPGLLPIGALLLMCWPGSASAQTHLNPGDYYILVSNANTTYTSSNSWQHQLSEGNSFTQEFTTGDHPLGYQMRSYSAGALPKDAPGSVSIGLNKGSNSLASSPVWEVSRYCTDREPLCSLFQVGLSIKLDPSTTYKGVLRAEDEDITVRGRRGGSETGASGWSIANSSSVSSNNPHIVTIIGSPVLGAPQARVSSVDYSANDVTLTYTYPQHGNPGNIRRISIDTCESFCANSSNWSDRSSRV